MVKSNTPSHRPIPWREAAYQARQRTQANTRERAKPRPVAPGTPVCKDRDEIAFQALLRREMRRLKQLRAQRVDAEPNLEAAAPASEPVEALHPDEIGLHWGESPVDLPTWDDPKEQCGLPWAASVLVLSSALLLVFNSFAIGKWAGEQPVTAYNGEFLDQASAYHARLKGLGLDAPLEAARSVWRGAKALTWADLGLAHEENEAAPPVAEQSHTDTKATTKS